MRLRTEDLIQQEVTSWMGETYAPKTCSATDAAWYPNSQVGSYTQSFGRARAMEDVVVPRFKKRQADGQVFFNLCKIRVFDVGIASGATGVAYVDLPPTCPTGTPGALVQRRQRVTPSGSLAGYFIRHGFDGPPGGFLHSSSDVDRLVKEAVTDCLAKRGEYDVNSWENLAELRSTLSAPLDIIRGILGRSKVTFRPWNHTKDSAGGWLAWRYGLRPLIGEIQTIVRNLEDFEEETKRVTTRSSLRSELSNQITGSLALGVWHQDILHNIQEDVIVRATALDEVAVKLRDVIGLGRKTLLRTPYELISYSHVADWFTTLGSFIAATIPVEGRALGGCYTVRQTASVISQTAAERTVSVSGLPLPGSGFGSASRTSRYETYVRTPGLGGPSLLFRHNFRLDDLGRVSEILAMLRQRLK